MYLGIVVGTVVATQRTPGLEGIRMLLVQPVAPDWTPNGVVQVACDAVQAGPGDRVYLVGSREAALAMPDTFVAVDAAIVGIVDSVDLEEAP